jgi:hypothetical protein
LNKVYHTDHICRRKGICSSRIRVLALQEGFELRSAA